MTNFYGQLLGTVTRQWGENGAVILPEHFYESEQAETLVAPQINPSTRVVQLQAGKEFLYEIKDAVNNLGVVDWLFLIPPIGSLKEVPKEFKEAYPSFSLHESSLFECLKAIPVPMHFGVIMPHDFLVRNNTKRNLLFGDGIISGFPSCYPELVIAHEHSTQYLGFPEIHHAFQMGTLFLRVGNEPPESVRFFKYSWTQDEQEKSIIVSDLRRLLKQGGGQTKYGYVYRGQLAPDSKLSFDLHSPATEIKHQELLNLGNVSSVGELFDVLPVVLHAVNDQKRFFNNQREGSIPVITGKNISSEGCILYETANQFIVADSEIPTLQSGDICIRKISSVTNKSYIVLATVSPNDPPATFCDSVIVLRPKEKLLHDEQELYAAYLKSEIVKHLMKAKGASLNLSIQDLMSLPLPRPSEDIKLAFRQLAEVNAALIGWRDEIQQARAKLLQFTDIAESRKQILTVGRRLRERVDAARQTDDLSYRIRNFFPFPVSFRWRTVLSSNKDLGGYKNILACAEILTCYLAMLVLAVAYKHGKKLGNTKCLADRFCGKGHKTNFGDWIAILREAHGSTQLKSLADETQFVELFTFLNETKVDSALKYIFDARNAFSHDGEPKNPEEISFQYEESKEYLYQYFKGAEFLSEYPLRYIEDVRYDTFAEDTFYSYRELRGDHPLVPILNNGVIKKQILEKGSLYTCDLKGEMYLLRPFLQRKFCTKCGNYSTFFIDTYNPREHECTLKNLEHGHKLVDQESISAFVQVGLIHQFELDVSS